MMGDHAAAAAMRAAWRMADRRPVRKGWPAGAPTVSRTLSDHVSHFPTPTGVVYRAEPYGPLTGADIAELNALLGGWEIWIDPLGSTHFPGSTIQVLFRRRP